MADYLTAIFEGTFATFVPLFVGLYLPYLWKRSSNKTHLLLTALASGIIFWFFLDVMNDAALLDVNQGFSGNYTHVILAALFGVGLLMYFVLGSSDSNRSVVSLVPNEGPQAITKSLSFAVAATIALGIGFHAVGEGIAIGSIIPSAPSIIDAIGGLGPGVAYVIHKLLEGIVVGVAALLAGIDSKGKWGILGLVAGIPTLIGFGIGLSVFFDPTYFFALGGAAVVYVELKYVPLFASEHPWYAYAFMVLIGFYLMYIAGLFHG